MWTEALSSVTEFCAGKRAIQYTVGIALFFNKLLSFILNHLVEGQFNVAKCNLARWKHKTMLASGRCS